MECPLCRVGSADEHMVLDDMKDDRPDGQLDAEALVMQRQTVERVQRAIETLPTDFREVIVLRELEGLSYKEIAAVKPWFQGKLDFSPPVEDLAGLGFPLVGARVDAVGGRPVAALVYQRRQHTIDVFIWPATDTAGALADARSFRGFQVRHWTRTAMALWAVSDLNDLELDQFVRALQP